MTEATATAADDCVDAVAFGDLHLADVRAYREATLSGSGIAPLFPLWRMDTATLAGEMLDLGIRAVLTCVDPRQVPAELAGRPFDRQLLADLPPGADPCGENGEFHTFVWGCPLFDPPIDITVGETVERDGFVYCDVLPA